MDSNLPLVYSRHNVGIVESDSLRREYRFVTDEKGNIRLVDCYTIEKVKEFLSNGKRRVRYEARIDGKLIEYGLTLKEAKQLVKDKKEEYRHDGISC